MEPKAVMPHRDVLHDIGHTCGRVSLKSFGPFPPDPDDQGLDPELLSFHGHRIHYD